MKEYIIAESEGQLAVTAEDPAGAIWELHCPPTTRSSHGSAGVTGGSSGQSRSPRAVCWGSLLGGLFPTLSLPALGPSC